VPGLAYPWYIWAEVDEGWVFDHETCALFCFSLHSADDIEAAAGTLEVAFARARKKVLGLRNQ
jgi:hypothetical protein